MNDKERSKVVDKTVKAMVCVSVEERLERLERLVVRLLLAMPLESLRSRLINTEDMPPATREALRNRYDTLRPYAGEEADYAKDCVFAICKDNIAVEQAIIDKVQAKADAEEQKKWRAQLEAEKAAAKKALDDAEAKLTKDRVGMPNRKAPEGRPNYSAGRP